MSESNKNGQKPPNSTEAATIGILSIFFGGMMFAALFENYSIYKLSVPLFVVSWAILLFIHEFGHALMAKALGWKVEKVSIGSGKLIGERKVFGMLTEFRAIPLSGYVLPRPADLIQPQLKNFLIYAAGPGIELLLVGCLWLILGTETLFHRQPVIWLIAIQTFSVAALFGAIMNLIPIPHETDHGKAPSDGLGMILAWKIPDSQYAEWIDGRE